MCDFMCEVKLSECENDFDKSAQEIKEAGRKLRDAGEGVSESFLTAVMLRALDPACKQAQGSSQDSH